MKTWCRLDYREFPPAAVVVWTSDGESVRKGSWTGDEADPLAPGTWADAEGSPLVVTHWMPIAYGELPPSLPEPPRWPSS